jgi:hypothetical protein
VHADFVHRCVVQAYMYSAGPRSADSSSICSSTAMTKTRTCALDRSNSRQQWQVALRQHQHCCAEQKVDHAACGLLTPLQQNNHPQYSSTLSKASRYRNLGVFKGCLAN